MLHLHSRIRVQRLFVSFVFMAIFSGALPSLALAARDYASIDMQQLDDTGDIMLTHVRISISTEDAVINAAELVLAYDSDALKIDHFDAANSDFQMAVPNQQERGVINIVRGTTKGLSFGSYQFVDIYFARTNPRRAYINLLPASQVTARDGQGTNVFDGRLGKLLL
ncbi:MAG TPA: hypothetical protein VJ579_02315 [Candidatus Paceibacterota bacterium]|nr:hypothetical protein [Candidatus Paceibacterota bacterium]